MDFTIYGTCVSRDVFNWLDNSIFKPKVTISSSPVSLFNGNILNIDSNDINVDTNFINSTLINYFQGNLRQIIDNRSEYLIFDLMSERFPVQTWKYENDSIEIPVTWNTYKLSQMLKKIEKNLEINNWRWGDSDKDVLKKNLENFCNIINKNYESSNIILISLTQIDEYISSDGKLKSFTVNRNACEVGIDSYEFRNHQNELVKFAESFVIEHLQGCWIIQMPENVICDSKHHFGPHPLHFHSLYYEYVAECIKLIVSGITLNYDRKKVNHQLYFKKIIYSNYFSRVRENYKNNICDIQFIGSSFLKKNLNSYYNFVDCICDVSIDTLFDCSLHIGFNIKTTDIEKRELFFDDVNKNSINKLKYSKAKWILFDFMHESTDNKVRCKLCNGYNSTIMKESAEILLENDLIINIEDDISMNMFPNIDKLCNLINQYRNGKNVIICESFYQEYYVDDKSRIHKYGDDIFAKNKELKKIYHCIEERLPGCKVIKKPSFSISYEKDIPDYLSKSEVDYYHKQICFIINNEKEEMRNALYKEQCFVNKMIFCNIKHKRRMYSSLR